MRPPDATVSTIVPLPPSPRVHCPSSLSNTLTAPESTVTETLSAPLTVCEPVSPEIVMSEAAVTSVCGNHSKY